MVLEGCSSSLSCVHSGVPQGSILGPLLFSIYINQLSFIPLSRLSKLQFYADDILLYRPIHSNSDKVDLQSDIDSIVNWVRLSGLQLNTSKTQLLIVSRLQSRPSLQLNVSGVPISESHTVNYLGVTLSKDLSWATRIDQVCLKAKRQARLIYRHFYLASPICKSQLYKSLVLPTLDYCSSLWDPAYMVHIGSHGSHF